MLLCREVGQAVQTRNIHMYLLCRLCADLYVGMTPRTSLYMSLSRKSAVQSGGQGSGATTMHTGWQRMQMRTGWARVRGFRT